MITDRYEYEKISKWLAKGESACHDPSQSEYFASRIEKQKDLLEENLRLREVVDQISKHDLKNPINALLNIPEMLLNAPNLLPDQVEQPQPPGLSFARLIGLSIIFPSFP